MHNILTEHAAQTHKEKMRVDIGYMLQRHLPEVLVIEDGCFEFPWQEDDFVCCRRQRNCLGLVAEHDGKIVGFMIYELHRTSLHILNFAVDVQLHRRGVGAAMVDELIGKLKTRGRTTIFATVGERSTRAQLFFANCGFHAVSILESFFEDSTQSAYLMKYSLGMPNKESKELFTMTQGECHGYRG